MAKSGQRKPRPERSTSFSLKAQGDGVADLRAVTLKARVIGTIELRAGTTYTGRS
jgi:hypothetical protein